MKSYVRWGTLYTVGAWAALATIALIPIQALVFLIHPPPTTALGFFMLFQENTLLALLNYDLLYMISIAVWGLVLVALGVVLWRTNEAVVAIALALGLVAVAVYFASNTAFAMLTLSDAWARAGDADKPALLGAGQALFAIYEGTANGVSYILFAIAGLMLAIVMLRSDAFSRTTAYVGIGMNVLMFVPPSVGMTGMIMAFLSLLPLIVWCALVARTFFALAGGFATPAWVDLPRHVTAS